MTKILLESAYSWGKMEILADATWDDSFDLKAIDQDGNIIAADLTAGGVITDPIIELYIRPRFDHAARILLLSSDPAIGGIIIDDAAAGKISIYVDVDPETRLLDIPVSAGSQHWDHFLIWNLNPREFEFWRGPIIVHPGRKL